MDDTQESSDDESLQITISNSKQRVLCVPNTIAKDFISKLRHHPLFPTFIFNSKVCAWPEKPTLSERFSSLGEGKSGTIASRKRKKPFQVPERHFGPDEKCTATSVTSLGKSTQEIKWTYETICELLKEGERRDVTNCHGVNSNSSINVAPDHQSGDHKLASPNTGKISYINEKCQPITDSSSSGEQTSEDTIKSILQKLLTRKSHLESAFNVNMKKLDHLQNFLQYHLEQNNNSSDIGNSMVDFMWSSGASKSGVC